MNDDSSKFDWKRFFEYLKPHNLLLAAAVAVSKYMLCPSPKSKVLCLKSSGSFLIKLKLPTPVTTGSKPRKIRATNTA